MKLQYSSVSDTILDHADLHTVGESSTSVSWTTAPAPLSPGDYFEPSAMVNSESEEHQN